MAQECTFACDRERSGVEPFPFLCSDCIQCIEGKKEASWPKLVMLAGICMAFDVEPPLHTIQTCVQHLAPPYLTYYQCLLHKLQLKQEDPMGHIFEPRE